MEIDNFLIKYEKRNRANLSEHMLLIISKV